MRNTLYGILRSALLFYRKLVKDLEEYGFEINPYDPCVAKKNGEWYPNASLWHVYDMQVSHKSEFEITRFSDYLISIYGGLSRSRGKVNDYLGMNLDFSDKGKLQVSMIP